MMIVWRKGKGKKWRAHSKIVLEVERRKQTQDWLRDFLGGPVVKNSISNAGHEGLIPSQGTRIPHAMGQISLHTTTTKPTYLNKILSATTKTQCSQK